MATEVDSIFQAGSELGINIGWVSGNGQTILRLQQDRNLVLYKNNSPIPGPQCLRFVATRGLASKDVTSRYPRGPFRVVVKACGGRINGRAACPRYSGKHARRRVKRRAAGPTPIT